MTAFIEKVRPLLFSEDEVLRHSWMFQLHDYPAVPVELVNELIAFCRTHEVTRKELFMKLENAPKNKESIELLLQWVRDVPLKDKPLVVRFLRNVEPKIIVHYKEELRYFMGRDYILLCEKLLAYETSDDGEFEQLWELYGEQCHVVERDFDLLQLAFLKHLINALIRVGVYDADEARLVIAEGMEEDFFSINGLMAIYAAGVLQLDDLIPQFVELMQEEDDDLVPILQGAIIRLQSEEVVKAVAPYILETEKGVFITVSTILKEAKTPFAEQVLLEAYPHATEIDMKEFYLDALTSHFSHKAFPLIENYVARKKSGRAFDMEGMFYSFYKAMGKEHPALASWRAAVIERKERFEKEIEAFTLKGRVREEFGKVGRNDPCICGSGKKFKKCCGKS